jgi:hypothetical protein
MSPAAFSTMCVEDAVGDLQNGEVGLRGVFQESGTTRRLIVLVSHKPL